MSSPNEFIDANIGDDLARRSIDNICIYTCMYLYTYVCVYVFVCSCNANDGPLSLELMRFGGRQKCLNLFIYLSAETECTLHRSLPLSYRHHILNDFDIFKAYHKELSCQQFIMRLFLIEQCA